MDLSIIIPSYNTRDLLDRCLESIYRSLKNSAISFDIIVIDNGSTDGSVELVGKKHPRVDVVRNKENIGYGKANNQAIVRAKGSYVLLLNSDILVKDDAVSHLYRFAKEKGNVFAGGRLFNEDGSAQASCGPFYRIPVVFFMLFARGDMWGATRYSPSSVRVVDWVSGACLIGTRKSFLDVGLFDEHMFMYMEEIEFLYRAKQKGYPVFFYPDARFIHRGA
ncbi:MAG: glycosyltransferase family 2 protein, partial [bacterium]|nr:glycosyltransferase family 2 protein [bacterium]